MTCTVHENCSTCPDNATPACPMFFWSMTLEQLFNWIKSEMRSRASLTKKWPTPQVSPAPPSMPLLLVVKKILVSTPFPLLSGSSCGATCPLPHAAPLPLPPSLARLPNSRTASRNIKKPMPPTVPSLLICALRSKSWKQPLKRLKNHRTDV